MNRIAQINQIIFLGVIISITLLINMFVLWPFILTLFTAVIFSVILHPIFDRIYEKTKIAFISSLASILLFLFVVFIPISVLGTILIQEIRNFYIESSYTSDYISHLESSIESKLNFLYPGIDVKIADIIRTVADWLFINTSGIITSVSSIALHLLIFLIALFYLLLHSKQLYANLILIIPLTKERTKKILSELAQTIHAVVKGSLSLFFISFFCTSVAFTAFSIPNPIFWSALGAFVAILPGIGTVFVIAPAVLFLLASGLTTQAILLGLTGLVLIGLIDFYIGPRLIEKGWRMHQFLILLSIIGGIMMVGPLGIFVGPVFLSLAQVLLVEVPSLLKEQTK